MTFNNIFKVDFYKKYAIIILEQMFEKQDAI